MDCSGEKKEKGMEKVIPGLLGGVFGNM